jgi:energy-converting hydrogenase Eha subunit A
MLKTFYLIFGFGLVAGGIYMFSRRASGDTDFNTTYAMGLCFTVGILCLVMYKYVDKLKKRD